MKANPLPKAKTERLSVREIDGETLVYDRSRDGASCLNEFAARVWRESDGETSVAAIAASVRHQHRRADASTSCQLYTGIGALHSSYFRRYLGLHWSRVPSFWKF